MPSSVFQGVVQSVNLKTIKVLVVRTVLHKATKKMVKLSKKYMVHDELNLAKVGEHVHFVECAPVSRTKKWKLLVNKS